MAAGSLGKSVPRGKRQTLALFLLSGTAYAVAAISKLALHSEHTVLKAPAMSG
jgi:hypothetical protein